MGSLATVPISAVRCFLILPLYNPKNQSQVVLFSICPACRDRAGNEIIPSWTTLFSCPFLPTKTLRVQLLLGTQSSLRCTQLGSGPCRGGAQVQRVTGWLCSHTLRVIYTEICLITGWPPELCSMCLYGPLSAYKSLQAGRK